jgi:predicted PurR-regulated permease PerM
MAMTRRTVLLLALLLGAAVLLAFLWQWIDTIPLGIAVAVVLWPLHQRASEKVPGALSAGLITLGLLAATLLGVFFTAAVMQENLATNEEILMKAARGVEILAPQFTGFGIPPEAVGETTTRMQGIVDAVANFWTGLSPSSAVFSLRVLLFLGALFLALWQGDRVLRWALVRTPQDLLGTWQPLARVSNDTLHSVLVVHLLIVALTFVLAVPFYYFLGYGHVLYLSLTTALCELVPVLGAGIPMVILLLYSFAIGDLRGFLLVFFVGYLVVALLPEITIRPILMGRRTHISPWIMFFGFLGGILLLGISGFLLGPLILAVAAAYYQIVKRERISRGENA